MLCVGLVWSRAGGGPVSGHGGERVENTLTLALLEDDTLELIDLSL